MKYFMSIVPQNISDLVIHPGWFRNDEGSVLVGVCDLFIKTI